jgi:uncharacterized repeat protein (TIGR04076 family)
MYEVEIEVKSVKGYCSAGYKEGDKIVIGESGIDISRTNCNICIYAISSLIPYITAFSRETSEDDWINMLEELQCPDSANTVTFKMSRKRI